MNTNITLKYSITQISHFWLFYGEIAVLNSIHVKCFLDRIECVMCYVLSSSYYTKLQKCCPQKVRGSQSLRGQHFCNLVYYYYICRPHTFEATSWKSDWSDETLPVRRRTSTYVIFLLSFMYIQLTITASYRNVVPFKFWDISHFLRTTFSQFAVITSELHLKTKNCW
jgi:hypothetical protein